MKTICQAYLPLLLILTIQVFPLANGFCSSTYTLPSTSCSFDYSFSDETCSNFQFSQCSWTVCTSYVSPYSSNCATYQTYTSSNWATCTAVCCSPNKTYPQVASSLQQCKADKSGEISTPWVAITASCIGFFLLSFVVAVFCCYKDRIYSSCTCFKNCCQKITDCLFYLITCKCFGREDQQQQAKKGDVNATSLQISIQPVAWVPQETVNEKLNDICSICLDGKPTVELQCHHVYHRKCILLCLKNKFECAMCRSHQIDHAKIYCEKCMHNFQKITIHDHFKFLDSYPQICKGCQQAELIKVQTIVVNPSQ